MRFVLPALAAVVPLVIAPGIAFYFDVTPKLVILLIGVAVALLLWRGDLPLTSRRNRIFLGLLAAQALSLILSTAFSTDPALSIHGGNWRRFGFVSQMVVLIFAALVASDCAANRERVPAYLKAIVAGGIPVALYAILQYFGWDPWLPRQSYHVGDVNLSIVRPPSTMGHANYLATYLLFVVFAGVALIRARTWIIAGSVASALACAAIVVTGTRAALLGLIAGAIVLLWGSWRSARVIQIAAAVVLLAMIFYFSPAGQGLRSRVTWIASEPAGGARPLLWRDSLRMSIHHPLLGYGPETFIREFPKQESIDLARAFPDFLHESPHNVFLDTLLAQGVFGLLVFIAFCAWAIFAARGTTWAAAALIACILAQLFTVFVMPVVLFFFLIPALLADPEPSGQRPLLRIAACSCALILGFYGVRLFIFDHALAQTNTALDKGDLAGAMVAHRQAARWAYPGSSTDVYYSRRLADLIGRSTDFRFKVQGVREAASAAINATRNAEDPPNAWYNLAAFLSMTSKPAEVEKSLRESIQAAPNWYKPHWVLAQLLVVEHRLDEAQREAEISVSCNPKTPEVLHTLENIRAAQRH